MCGICGILQTDETQVYEETLRKMSAAIAHRGPDGEGIWVNGCVGLGHRRLAILDLSPYAHQPMQSFDGNYTITYNGEIYNFKELRLRLQALGYRFTSSGDTEVLLNAYIEWGAACLNMLNGMFAFAIYDNKKRELFCARDRYGIKPFYYASISKTFLFASEQKAIYQHPQFTHTLDLESLVEYFTFQNIFTDNTLEKSIKILEPGCYMYVDLRGATKPVRYWDFNFREEHLYNTKPEYAECLDHLLVESVNRQLVSDTEIGSFLSGGMDSGTITCIASRSIPHMKTFTCGYDVSTASPNELGFDERRKSEIMAHAFVTEHFELILQPDDIARALPNVCYHNEEPRVGQSYTNYLISKLASKFVKVCFSGTGGDELFGGYPWRYYKAAASTSFDEFVDNYFVFWQRLIPEESLKEIFSPIWASVQHIHTKEIFRNVFKGQRSELKSAQDYINQSLYFEAKTFLHGMLMVEDKLTMAYGLESRVPMLDNDLVDFAMKLPVSYKLNNLEETLRLNENDLGIKSNTYFLRTNNGKTILRDVMHKYMPEEIYSANKQGFSAPDASWFRNELSWLVEDLIHNPNTVIWNFMNKAAVSALVNEHLSGKTNRRLLIWSLLNFEQLLKTWF